MRLDFRGDRNPDYWDFFYFATLFGAASQTSDVSILTKPLRRLATLHAIISFFFNTAVLAKGPAPVARRLGLPPPGPYHVLVLGEPE